MTSVDKHDVSQITNMTSVATQKNYFLIHIFNVFIFRNQCALMLKEVSETEELNIQLSDRFKLIGNLRISIGLHWWPLLARIVFFIKQFVVTNCSKERPGSIVNETLKNGILMLKDALKKLDFHADFKYISFIKFSLCHQKLRAWENVPHFGK